MCPIRIRFSSFQLLFSTVPYWKILSCFCFLVFFQINSRWFCEVSMKPPSFFSAGRFFILWGWTCHNAENRLWKISHLTIKKVNTPMLCIRFNSVSSSVWIKLQVHGENFRTLYFLTLRSFLVLSTDGSARRCRENNTERNAITVLTSLDFLLKFYFWVKFSNESTLTDSADD